MTNLIKVSKDTEVVTDKEIEMVEGLIKYSTVRSLAREWKINDRTMEARVKNLKAKIGCDSLMQLVAAFFRANLIK